MSVTTAATHPSPTTCRPMKGSLSPERGRSVGAVEGRKLAQFRMAVAQRPRVDDPRGVIVHVQFY